MERKLIFFNGTWSASVCNFVDHLLIFWSLCVVVVCLQLWFIAALTVCDLDAIKTPDRRRIDVRELDKRHTRMHTNKPEFLERSLHVYFVIEDVTLFSCVTCSPFFCTLKLDHFTLYEELFSFAQHLSKRTFVYVLILLAVLRHCGRFVSFLQQVVAKR